MAIARRDDANDSRAEIARHAQIGEGRPAPEQRNDETNDTHETTATPRILRPASEHPVNERRARAAADIERQKSENFGRTRGGVEL